MARVTVSFMSSFRPALGGAESLDIEANTLRELMRRLLEQYPRLQHHLDEGIAIAINGEIYRDNWNVEIQDGSEVFLLSRIQGG